MKTSKISRSKNNRIIPAVKIFAKRAAIISLAAFLFVSAAQAQTVNRQTALAEVVAVENAFADRAADSGTRAAFIEFAADSGLIFNTKPENAKELWKKREANASFLNWRPAWADVSSNGDLGYTTGSWAFSASKSEAAQAWGEYFTIWKKQADGSWRFEIDLGVPHGPAEVVADNYKSPAVKEKAISAKADSNVWRTLENSFGESLTKNGAKRTYEKFAAEQIRLLREDQMPFQGKTNALAAIADEPVKINALGGGGASGDLAYAYGEYESKIADGKTRKGFYTRVWKREAKNWRVAAEVVHLIPPPKD